LKEIYDDYAKKTKTIGPVNVLIMVKDEKTLEDVRSYLMIGKQKTMTMRWLRYLEGYNDRSRSVTKNAGWFLSHYGEPLISKRSSVLARSCMVETVEKRCQGRNARL
jgi:hypothetical protein